VTWLPYELHPEAPVEGIPRETYFRGARFEQMRTHLETMAAEVGLTMKPRDVIINSRRALGAAEFAREQGKFDTMHHALLKAHWEGTGRLENVDDLVRIGTEVGLDPDELRAAIDEDRYATLIDENRAEAESVGINAIPAHIFGRRYLVLGAQPYEAFLQVIDRLREEAAPG
jgi:predicted DsbA family dithiol-disulfide isomerase